MKVSVIVPVYNMEKYLEKCLESIVNQTFREFEVILINDGSTDISGKICDIYSSVYKNFKVFHKKNEGLVSARITGIKNASGKYIAFVDADDWVEPVFLEVLVTAMEEKKADIVAGGCIKEEYGESSIVLNRIKAGMYDKIKLKKEIYPRMLYYKGFFEFGVLPYVWNKLYKKELLVKCYKNVDTSIYDGEDVAIVFPYLLEANRMVITEDASYHYYRHNRTMTSVKKKDYYCNTSKLYLHLYHIFLSSCFKECLLPQLDQYMRMMIWQGDPERFMEAEKHIFPFDRIPSKSKIILYGAGMAGKRFHHQVKQSKYCEIVLWVDKNYERKIFQGSQIKSIDEIAGAEYDYIVVAIENKMIQSKVREILIKLGIQDDRIVFCQ